MSTKKRVVSAALAAAVGVSLLCGFGFAKKDYVYQQFETAEPVTSVTVKDASANVTIQAADTDHITVRYATLPDEDPLYDIWVQDGRLLVEAREDIDVDTTDDGGPALVRIQMDGHSINPFPDRELTITLPDKQYEELEAGLAVGTLKVEGVDAKTFSVASASGKVEVSGVQAGQLKLASAAGNIVLRDAKAENVKAGTATGSIKIENLDATEEVSAANAVGSVSLKQVTTSNLVIGAVIGSIQLEDVSTDSYTKAGILVWNSGSVQDR